VIEKTWPVHVPRSCIGTADLCGGCIGKLYSDGLSRQDGPNLVPGHVSMPIYAQYVCASCFGERAHVPGTVHDAYVGTAVALEEYAVTVCLNRARVSLPVLAVQVGPGLTRAPGKQTWNPRMGVPIRTLEYHSSPLSSMSVYRGFLITGAEDSCMVVWNMATGDCVELTSAGTSDDERPCPIRRAEHAVWRICAANGRIAVAGRVESQAVVHVFDFQPAVLARLSASVASAKAEADSLATTSRFALTPAGEESCADGFGTAAALSHV
jgi:hypothetical protein